MKLAKLFDDDRAVSPVIGVILMVAITVILAAVIGTFVLGLGDQVQQTTPRASFAFDTSNSTQNVTVTHESGDAIPAGDLKVTGTTSFSVASYGPNVSVSSDTWANMTGASDVSAGSSVELNAGSLNDASTDFAGQTVRIVYDSSDSENTATLAKREIPE